MQPLLLEAKATGLSQAPTNLSRFSRSKGEFFLLVSILTFPDLPSVYQQ